MGEGQQAHIGRHLAVHRVEIEFAVGRDVGHADDGAATFGDQLPWHDVGVVLHAGQQDHIALAQRRQGMAVGDQVDRLGRAGREHQFVGAHVDEGGQSCPCSFVGIGRFHAQRMHGARHIGIVLAIEGVGGVDYLARLLRGVRGIEIHQWLAMDSPRQHREIGATCGPVDVVRGTCRRSHDGVAHDAASSVARRASSRGESISTSDRSPMDASASRQNACVSSARACAAGMPRLRR